MFKSTFSTPSEVHSTMNTQQPAQEARKARVNRFKKETKKEAQQMDIKQLLDAINEAETQLIMLLAMVENNPLFATNTMGAVQDILTQIIDTLKPHTNDLATIINEYNSISWDLTETVAISFKDIYPVMGEAYDAIKNQKCPMICKEDIDAVLDLADEQITLMNCTSDQACDVIKGILSVISKIKLMAPRILRLLGKIDVLGKTLQAKFGEIKIDPYYEGNAFDGFAQK